MPSRSGDIEAALRTQRGAGVVQQLLSAANLQFTTEDDLQAAIQECLDGHGVYPQREVVLSDEKSRIDLLAGSVGIEVKIEGSWSAVVRQLTRYAKCPEIVAVVLVTSRAKHHHIPEQLAGKPIYLVSLLGSAL